MEFSRFSLACLKCGQDSRVHAVSPLTSTVADSTPRYCPFCSQPAIASRNTDKDYWDMMAESYTKEFRQSGIILPEADVNPELLQELFAIWEPLKQYTYGTFIRKALEEPDFLEQVMVA